MDSSLLILSSTTFILSLVICIIPKQLIKVKSIKKVFPYITIFAAGFMLAVLFLDLIPHLNEPDVKVCKIHGKDKCPSSCVEKHHKHDHKLNVGMFVAGCSFIFLLAIDSILLQHSHCDNKEAIRNHSLHTHDSIGTCNTEGLKYVTSKIQAFIFILAISIHSLFEGLAFHKDSSKTYEVSILFHKALESFALGFTIFTTDFSFSMGLALAGFYSILTPLGMFIGNVNWGISKIFDGLALGSMVFIVFVEMLPPSFHSKDGNSVVKILTLGLGYLITAVVIYMTPHQHNH
ncbi:Zinc transporter ZIP1 [Astathelohania contejeani]|uniref:Zinc transporter ZIP1 n=1 Tax=Astathelohania contejeani TaxID=164912 RepID=A0ABQ7HY40_9MICR|nr:Zinc transporter ZIP1 [Thelohania contejeani]